MPGSNGAKLDDLLEHLDERHEGLWRRLDETVTRQAYFKVFKQLSDNYSPTLTVSRVQGPLVEALARAGAGSRSPLQVSSNARGSGSITLTVGSQPAPVWLSGHADVCSYLTGEPQGGRYPLTPFCMHRARPGRRAAVALAAPQGVGPLRRVAYGDMVTEEDGQIFFETEDRELLPWTRVVHHLPATWDEESDAFHGFIDNQGTCAALILAARVLSHYEANVTLVLNDEEEGPVDKGNQGFSRGLTRLLNRTPHERLPRLVVVGDVHQQESHLADQTCAVAQAETQFGQGALFSGAASGARGAVVPPQIVAFNRRLSAALAERGVRLTENNAYVSRSDDVSALQYTQNIALIGFPGLYAHFDRTPQARAGDLVHLTKTLVVYALLAQDEDWQAAYL